MLYTFLDDSTEVLLQPFGSFIVNRKKNIFNVVNKAMTASLITMACEAVPTKKVRDAQFKTPESKKQFDTYVEGFVSDGYLSQGNEKDDIPQSSGKITFVDDRAILKATHAEVEITNRCNLKCSYCYADANLSKIELTRQEWLEILFGMYDKGLRAITISGGEPFIRNDMMDLISDLSSKFIITLYTNGYYIDAEVAERLQKYNIKSVQVSLDSMTEYHHDSIRGKGSHAAALRGIYNLINNNIPVQISTVVTRNNYNELGDIQNFCKEIGASLQADAVKYLGRAKDIDKQYWQEEYETEFMNNYSTSRNEYTINPICQSQIGFVAISHAGVLKPCNQREAFFEPTKSMLLEAKERKWWNSFYGNNALGKNINKTHSVRLEDIKSNPKANCKLQSIFVNSGVVS